CDSTTRWATAWRLDDTSGTAILMTIRAFGLPSKAFHGVMGPRLTRPSMAVKEFLRSNWHVVTTAVTAGAIVCAAVRDLVRQHDVADRGADMPSSFTEHFDK